MKSSGPLARLQALIDSDRLTPDPAQLAVVRRMQQLHDELLSQPDRWLDRRRHRHRPVQGIYLHGPVGRGKTLLMDLLAQSLSDAGVAVWRIHFHRFMDRIQDELRSQAGKRDPLPRVAADIAQRCRLLCFDEFHVSDIGDAMLLGGLLQALFERGLCLVTTSNTAPVHLYADGLQRERFLPAIAALETHCEVLELDAPTDYRLRTLSQREIYFQPLGADAEARMLHCFDALTRGETGSDQPLTVRGRKIRPRRRVGPVVWFDFETLCTGPRASSDYIDLARRFDTLLLSEVPLLGTDDEDAARRFIHLVDECYDRGVNLILSAAASPQELYQGERLAAAFQRTASRLIEMQSQDYLAREHQSWNGEAAALRTEEAVAG